MALGVVGLLLVVLLTAWVIHDIDKATGAGGALTITKIDAIALVGVTPGLVSLLVIAFGAYLQTRSMELLLGVAVDSEFLADEDDGDDDFTHSV
jgi:hypothetical protein